MNIIEAIKSGKGFRRKDWQWRNVAFIEPFKNGVGMQRLEIDYASIVADDWEVEAAPVTITREQFFEAYAYSVGELKANSTNSELMEMMAKRLGL
jgi:hypothetical protein